MATVSFVNLDQSFLIGELSQTTFSSLAGDGSFFYSWFTTGGDDWDMDGSGITTNGTVPTGGVVNHIYLDLDDDNFDLPEVDITGLNINLLNFNIGSGTAVEQSNRFWRVALQGADTFNLTLANYSLIFEIAGDGLNLSNGALLFGANDSFLYGGAPLTGASYIYGDYVTITDGTAVGGDDYFTSGAHRTSGDFSGISDGAAGFGGDDVMAPVALADNAEGIVYFWGDVGGVSGVLTGGDDLIDLRSTNVSALTQEIWITGDAHNVNAFGFTSGGDDTVHGSSHNDHIYGEAFSGVNLQRGNDQLFGNAGNDTIFGQTGNDLVDGGAGNDLLDGGAGADMLIGGSGVDTASYADAAAAVTIRLWNGTGQGSDAQGDILSTIENVTGSAFNDAIVGEDNVANLLIGGAGDDGLFGLSGNDTVKGGTGADNMDGGDGVDAVDYSDTASAVTIRLWNPTGQAGAAAGDKLTALEHVIGSAFSDAIVGADNIANKLVGNAGNDSLSGLSGNDTIEGGAGADVIDGGSGTDYASYGGSSAGVKIRLWNGTGEDGDAAGDVLSGVEGVIGSSHNDVIIGADGVANILYGSLGNDTLYGLTGNDTFVFARNYDQDVIGDFAGGGAAAGDVIQLSEFSAAFDSFAEVMAAATQAGANTVIDFGSGDTLILAGVSKASLHANDFLFG